MKQFLILIIILCLSLVLLVSPLFAATSGNYEYNDYKLYSTGGTQYAAGALKSNNSSLSTFQIAVNVDTNQWYITGGTWTNIPFPNGTTIQYTDRTTFLTSAYINCNGNRYNFTIINGDDYGPVYYSQSIPAGPYYPLVSIYLPTTGQTNSVPSTPILSATTINGRNALSWTPSNYSAIIYCAEDSHLSGEPVNVTATTSPWINNYGDGYYYIKLSYMVDGVTQYTDYSNRIYLEMSESTDPDPGEESDWQKFLNFLNNILGSLDNAASTIGQFLSNAASLFNSIFDIFPDEIKSVFTALVIVGLVLGLFLK